MDKLLKKRLTPRDTAVIIAALIIVGSVLVLYFLYKENGLGGSQPEIGSIFKGLILKRIQLRIAEYSTQRERRRSPGVIHTWTERAFEVPQTVRDRPVKYLPTPTPTPRFSIPTAPAFHEALQEQIGFQLEMGSIPVNAELPPPEEPGKETILRAATGPPGNGYLAMEIEVEHSPGIATFQISCRLYRNMQLPGSEKGIFEIPIVTSSTPRYRVRESDFRTAVSYEVEQMLQTDIVKPYSRATWRRIQ